MSTTPIVSVIVPVYNVEKYLSKCLDSIIEQEYKNLEIIIVDDGTPDNSGKIADDYAEKDERVRVIHKTNGGVASARNVGMDAATGEFILFVDSDDWISKDHISHFMYLQSIDNADMCMTTEFFTQKTDVQEKDEKIETMKPADAAALLLSPKMVVGTYNKFYRREWLNNNSLRQNEKLFSGEGLNFIVTVAQYANHVTVSNRKIYYYRRNVSESATTKFNINMFINNELSLDDIKAKKIVESRKFDDMLNLFRTHLMINGVLAILTYASPKDYPEEYKRWRKAIRQIRMQMIKSKYVPRKSKIRIICASICPRVWAKLAKAKRKRIFKESV
jgi:glycosyltransferase involved in cell wall biosynthesis